MAGNPVDWITQFDVADYLQNEPMIRKLFEERQLYLTECNELTEKVATLQVENSALTTRWRTILVRYDGATRDSSKVFIVSFLAATAAGLGANRATDSPDDWMGWFLIALAFVLELYVAWTKPRGDGT